MTQYSIWKRFIYYIISNELILNYFKLLHYILTWALNDNFWKTNAISIKYLENK